MKTQRENLLSLLRREGYDYLPVEFSLCPLLEEEYKLRTGGEQHYADYFNLPWKNIEGLEYKATADEKTFRSFYDFSLKEGTYIDNFGVAHEPGSEAAKHMTYMRNPMKKFTSVEQFEAYPYPELDDSNLDDIKKQIESIHNRGFASVGNMQTTIWESAWYMRGMEELMMDMLTEEPTAQYHLSRITDLAVKRACAYARAGADILFLGDDIGMQKSIMMSKTLYADNIKYRLKGLISEVRKIKPDIIIFYHSCGFVTPFIPDLIEAGVDVLNPVQPECMDFREIFEEFGGQISFHGTIGTQTTMPFGSPDDVKRAVKENLKIAGDKGGLFVAPTHMLEPEVPWENIIAYVDACRG